jgi:hypothetical protein
LLPPEHPFPAGFDDVIAVYKWLVQSRDLLLRLLWAARLLAAEATPCLKTAYEVDNGL